MQAIFAWADGADAADGTDAADGADGVDGTDGADGADEADRADGEDRWLRGRVGWGRCRVKVCVVGRGGRGGRGTYFLLGRRVRGSLVRGGG